MRAQLIPLVAIGVAVAVAVARGARATAPDPVATSNGEVNPAASSSDVTAKPGSPAPADELRPAGGATLPLGRAPGLDRFATGLTLQERFGLGIGRSFFRDAWIPAPATTTARDGLGPLFEAHACASCHPGGGAARIGLVDSDPSQSADGEMPLGLVMRLALPGRDHTRRAVPDPSYGDQIQRRGIAARGAVQTDADEGKSPPIGEGRPALTWQTTRGEYGDGESFELRRPVLRLDDPAYGALDPQTVMAARRAPSLIGAGLLDAVPEQELLERADPDDRDGDGISGRPNRVPDLARSSNATHVAIASAPTSAPPPATAIGRFGWKAGQPTLRQQIASAFRDDMGITSALYPAQPCTDAETGCKAAPSGADAKTGVEITLELLDAVTDLVAALGVPARRKGNDDVERGRKLFRDLGCAGCHTPQARHRRDGAISRSGGTEDLAVLGPASPRHGVGSRRRAGRDRCWHERVANRAALGSRTDASRRHGASARRARPLGRGSDPVARRRSRGGAGALSRCAAKRSRGRGRVRGMAMKSAAMQARPPGPYDEPRGRMNDGETMTHSDQNHGEPGVVQTALARPRRSAAISVATVLGLVVALLSATQPGCGGGGGASSEPSGGARGYPALLSALGDEVIVPGYENAASHFAALADSARNLCAAPSAMSLDATRAAWRDAIDAWLETEWVTFGPVKTANRRLRIYFWPDPNDNVRRSVEQLLARTDPVTEQLVAGQSVAAQGLPALERLLFDPDQDTLTALEGAGGSGSSRRCDIVVAISANLRTIGAEIASDWRRGGGGFVDQLVLAGSGSNAFATPDDAVGQVLNDIVAEIEQTKNQRLGDPLGADGSGVKPFRAESRLSGNSLPNAVSSVNGVRAAVAGGSYNVRAFLSQIGRVELSQRLITEIDGTVESAQAIPVPFDQAVQDPALAPETQQLFDVATSLTRTIKNDVSFAMSVTIGFNGNDGD